MSTTDAQTDSPPRELRWFQYRLRTLLILGSLVALGLGLFAAVIQPQMRERELGEQLANAGFVSVGSHAVDEEGEFRQHWRTGSRLNSFFREKADVFAVYPANKFWSGPTPVITDSGLALLKAFPQLRKLVLDSTGVTDAGLQHLEGLRQLRHLNLNRTAVTGTGLAHLKELTQLKELWLHETRLTRKGLEHVKQFSQLQSLSLACDNITDADLEYVEPLGQLRELDLSQSQVTDAGLVHLEALTKLQYLCLMKTRVSGAGAEKLRQTLPNCKIYRD